jgi:hypothetical protein
MFCLAASVAEILPSLITNMIISLRGKTWPVRRKIVFKANKKTLNFKKLFIHMFIHIDIAGHRKIKI